MQKTYTFHVNGMHCNSCVLLTESELKDVPEISHVKASLAGLNVEVSGDFGDKTAEHIADDLSVVLKPHGYTLSLQKQKHVVRWEEFRVAVPIAFAFAVFFVILQKVGLVNLVHASNVSYGTAFVIGIIASLSTCMAVVGGLVLSISATFAKEGDRVKPQLLFHMGRIVSFFVLGGVIGTIGSAFALTTTWTFVLSMFIGIVMLIMGVNLLDVVHWSKRLQPTIPKFLSKHAIGISKLNHTLTPFFVGIATFFLPCGFTQSMQIYTLSTGSFLKGGFTMLFFALGTLPMLALLSFSSFTIRQSLKSGVFFKTAGLIVLMFALFNLINGLVVIGVIPPVFNF